MRNVLLMTLTFLLVTTGMAKGDSLIPPIVIQGCGLKVKAASASSVSWGGWNFSGGSHFSVGSFEGPKLVGFDVSFVNTTDKTATVVMLNINGHDFTDVGTFTPGAVIRWRLDAPGGPSCYAKAVRFADGTEWDASNSNSSSDSGAAAPSKFVPVDDLGRAYGGPIDESSCQRAIDNFSKVPTARTYYCQAVQ